MIAKLFSTGFIRFLFLFAIALTVISGGVVAYKFATGVETRLIANAGAAAAAKVESAVAAKTADTLRSEQAKAQAQMESLSRRESADAQKWNAIEDEVNQIPDAPAPVVSKEPSHASSKPVHTSVQHKAVSHSARDRSAAQRVPSAKKRTLSGDLDRAARDADSLLDYESSLH